MQSRACKTMTTKRIHSSLTSSTRCRFQSDNPKAAASQAHSRYEAYKSSQTIGAAFGSGCTRLDLQFDMDRGYLIVLKGDPTSSPAGVLVPQFAVGQVKHDSCASGSPLLISTSPGTSIKKRARFKQPDPTTFVTSQPLQDVPQVSRALEGRGETLEAEIRQGLFNIMPQAISAEAGLGLQCFCLETWFPSFTHSNFEAAVCIAYFIHSQGLVRARDPPNFGIKFGCFVRGEDGVLSAVQCTF